MQPTLGGATAVALREKANLCFPPARASSFASFIDRPFVTYYVTNFLKYFI